MSSFLGNLVFNELGTTTSASGSGKVSADGGPAVPVGGDLLKTVTLTGLDGFAGGYFSGSSTASFGSFVTLAVSDAMITLSIDGQGFGSIVAQPQNQLKFGFFATAVPVPPAVWLLGSALGALGTIMRRRT